MKQITFLVTDDKAKELDALMQRYGFTEKSTFINSALTLFEWYLRQKEQGFLVGRMDESEDEAIFREVTIS